MKNTERKLNISFLSKMFAVLCTEQEPSPSTSQLLHSQTLPQPSQDNAHIYVRFLKKAVFMTPSLSNSTLLVTSPSFQNKNNSHMQHKLSSSQSLFLMIFIFSNTAGLQCSANFLLHGKVTQSHIRVYNLFSYIYYAPKHVTRHPSAIQQDPTAYSF